MGIGVSEGGEGRETEVGGEMPSSHWLGVGPWRAGPLRCPPIQISLNLLTGLGLIRERLGSCFEKIYFCIF